VKFRVERDVLAEAVTWVARGLPARPPVPVLAGILMQADDDGTLTLSAFDYEVSAKVTVAAEVAEAGTVLVLGRLLADISRNLPDRPIDVATDGSKVQVTCGSSRFSLLMMPADDYPTLPTSPEPSGTIDGHLFTQAVAQVSVAALIEVVRRVALVAERTTPVLHSFSEDGLVVEAGGTEEARASEAMEATFTGEPLTIGFNPQYLIDGLQNLGAQTAVLSFVDAFKPAVISPAAEDGEIMPGYRYLIMPIRVTR